MRWMWLVGLAWAGPSALVSPGYLADSHRDLDGTCDACHVPFEGVPDHRCATCHAPIAERRAAAEGFHGLHRDEPCHTCHTDHRGRRAQQTAPEAVALFDHGLTRFPLSGRHARLSCEGCHDRPLGELTGCSACHEDQHGGDLGTECGACHGDRAWKDQRHPLDAHALDLRGAHASQTCVDCHYLGAALDVTPSCATCHEQGHGGTKAPCEDCHEVTGWRPAEFDHGPCGCQFPGAHQTAPCLACHVDFDFTNTPERCESCHRDDLGHDDIGGCARCHTALSWTDRVFDHDRSTSFAVDGAHLGVSCAQCHPDGFGQAVADCASCHASHEERGHPPLGACATCHTTRGWAPSTFDHATTGFPLTGQHDAASCWKCHPDLRATYPKPPTGAATPGAR